MTRRLMLIDGNSLTYRAFHALPPDLRTTSGQITNAVLGFTNMLIYLIKDHKPDGVVVAWDRREPTFRHEQLESYKANRDKAPDELISQLGVVKEVLAAIGIPQVDQVGIEADDLLATLASAAQRKEVEALIVTGDRDSYQLVSDPYIKVVYNKRGVTDYAIYDEAGIEDRTGVHPRLYVDYAALRGDKSDNLPGVPGVGEKTAAKLINSYGGALDIYDHLDSQTPKLRSNLEENRENVEINLDVMKLLTDVEGLPDVEDLLKPVEIDVDSVREVFESLEFGGVFGRLLEAFGLESTEQTVNIEYSTKCVTASEILELLAESESFGYSITGANSDSLAVSADGDSVLVCPLASFEPNQLGELVDLLNRAGTSGAVHSIKGAHTVLANYGLDLADGFDLSLAGYLSDPTGRIGYSLKEQVSGFLGIELPEIETQAQGQLLFDDSNTPDELVCQEASAAALLAPVLQSKLNEQDLTQLFNEIEVPLARSLARMEDFGIGVDRAVLKGLAEEMLSESERLSTEVQELAGESFNVNSTKVLQTILFEKLGLKAHKKTKTGFSTNQAALEKIRGDHPIVETILQYRAVEKLRSTYGQPLLDVVDHDDRIRASFRQTVARTGRLSSENPNLHNIPARSEMGKRFRTAFIAAEGNQLLVADYNQIELRCIAHLADDPGLIEAFNQGLDVHRATAARMFDIEADQVSKDQRENAKTVSYGLAYGMEAYGLAQRLNISTGEAKEFLDSYFESFPAVKQYMDDAIAEARERGYTITLFGRRLAIPELASSNFAVKAAAERQAMNAGIQGLAADIFKLAIVNIDRLLHENHLAGRLVLQVHDEVIIECPEKELADVERLVLEEMKSTYKLKVPLEVNAATGKSWADAKA